MQCSAKIMFICMYIYIHVCQTCRLTGRAVFRSHLLAREGRLIDVPYQMTSDTITVDQMADYLEPMLTAAAGGSLDAYRN